VQSAFDRPAAVVRFKKRRRTFFLVEIKYRDLRDMNEKCDIASRESGIKKREFFWVETSAFVSALERKEEKGDECVVGVPPKVCWKRLKKVSSFAHHLLCV
jgi:hypothetical protein